MTEKLVPNKPLDQENPDSASAPLCLLTLLVFTGGCLGTGLRLLVNIMIPESGLIPLGILVINVTGSFTLGMLLETLARHGTDTGQRRQIRLFAGTGLIGGYTTYSTLATDTMLMLHSGHVGAAIFYVAVSMLAGLGASMLGIYIGRLIGSGKRS